MTARTLTSAPSAECGGLAPYASYRDSGLPWLGAIPSHWDVRRNGRLFAERVETGDQSLAFRDDRHGIVLAEALASGVPCVSTELGTGTSWVNQHGTTGLVVPPGDATALAEAIRQLLADPAMRQRMATAARTRALEQFDRRAMLDRIEQVYHAVRTD